MFQKTANSLNSEMPLTQRLQFFQWTSFLWGTNSILTYTYGGFPEFARKGASAPLFLLLPPAGCTELHINDGLADPCPRGSGA